MPKINLDRTSENISITLPSWLIQITDEFCERHDQSRSSLIRKALKHYLAGELQHDNDYWQKVYSSYFDK